MLPWKWKLLHGHRTDGHAYKIEKFTLSKYNKCKLLKKKSEQTKK